MNSIEGFYIIYGVGAVVSTALVIWSYTESGKRWIRNL